MKYRLIKVPRDFNPYIIQKKVRVLFFTSWEIYSSFATFKEAEAALRDIGIIKEVEIK